LYWKDKGYPLSKGCVEGFNRFISVDPKTRGNIMQNFNKPLKIFEAESCRLATSASDFDFNDLRRKRMSVYIVLSPTGMEKYKQLINLFFSQLVRVNTQTLPEHDKTLKYQCLLVLDEFTSMGRVGII
ncbi:type IV secretory system conjugative DNA transfer family protein, partial [Escherichia coli]|nr:type IV secretory system conjugative DNA transfer family protein [Escherichia coli]